MSFRPLWPAMPPPCLILAVPGEKSSSSCTTRISSGLILKNPASICTARPLAFMKLCGMSSQAPLGSCRPTSAWNLLSLRSTMPLAEAKRSTSQNPALWRVRSYSLPGLPRPTTRWIKAAPLFALLLVFLLGLLGLFRLLGLLGGLRSSLRSRLVTLGRRLAFLRRGSLLGRRYLGGRHHGGCGRFLFLGDQRRHGHGRDDRVLVLVQRRLDAS